MAFTKDMPPTKVRISASEEYERGYLQNRFDDHLIFVWRNICTGHIVTKGHVLARMFKGLRP